MSTERWPHLFAVKALDKLPGFFKPRRYLYYCARCKWSFIVNDGGRGTLTPLGDKGKPLAHEAAVARAETFASGPCPAMRVVAEADSRANGSNGAVAPLTEHRRVVALTLDPRKYHMRSNQLPR